MISKKIAIIAQNIVPGGVYRLGIMEAKYLKEQCNYECKYYSIIKPSRPWSLVSEYGIKYDYLINTNIKIPILENILSRVLGSHNIINDKEVNLIIAHNNPSANIAHKMKKKYGIPYILYLHDPGTYPIIGDLYWFIFSFLKKIASQMESDFVRNAEFVLVNSKRNKLFLETYYGLDPNRVILLYPTTTIQRLNVAKLPKKRDSFFLIVGRIDNHPTYSRLYKIMKSLPYLKVTVAGYKSPKTGDKIIEMFKRDDDLKNRIDFIIEPEDSELIRLYQTARAFISPGHENFNMAALEAIFNGCPILVSNTSGICEIFDDAEEIKKKIALPSDNMKIWTDTIEYFMFHEKDAIALGIACWKIGERYDLKSHMIKLNKLII